MANTSIFGVPYTDIINVFLGDSQMGFTIDAGSFEDDGETPPITFSFTLAGGTLTYTGLISSITGVAVTS